MREKDPTVEIQLHHPFVAVIQHITSPLTSALCIFGVYKASHIPKIRAWIRAVWIIRTTPPTVKAHHVPQKISPFGHGHHRSYSTTSAARASALSSPFLRNAPSLALRTKAESRFLAARPGFVGIGTLGSLGSLGLKRTMMASSAIGLSQQLQQRRNFSDVVTGGAAAGEILKSATFFPSSWYVTSTYTGQEIVWTSQIMQDLLNYAHVDFGLPWWQCIMGVTLMFRFAVLPLNVSLVRNTLRLHEIKPELSHLKERMNSKSPEERLDAANSLVSLLKEKKCHPVKNVISPFLFPPMFLSLFGAVYDISTHIDDESGGVLWFPDLAVADPTFVLPVLSALSWLATIEMASGEHFPLKPWILSATRLGAIAFIPITMTLPSGVFIFWLTSNLFACCRAWVVRQPKVARAFGIPRIRAPKQIVYVLPQPRD